MTTVVTALSLAKKIGDIAGTNRTYSNGRSKKDKYDHSVSTIASKVCA